MPVRAVGLRLILVLLSLALAGCSIQVSPSDDNTNDAPAEPTAEPQPTLPPPTQVPSGSFFQIDGVTVEQVVLWDFELPAEYAATHTTLYHRTDTRNWEYVADLPAEGRIIGDPSDPDRLYLGDHPPCLSEREPIGFYRSLDGGNTWDRVEEADNIRPIMVWPEDPDIIIGSRCGLAISLDGGLTWERHLPDSEFDLTRLTATQIGLFGVFTSESEVSYLRQIGIEDPSQPEFAEPIISFWGPGAVHATGERILVGESGGVHFSDDGGRTWSSTREGLEDVVASVNPLEENIPEKELEAGLGIYSIAPHPQDSTRIFLGSIRGLYLSEDSGQTWGKSPEVEDRPVRQLTFALGGSILYVTTDDGVIVLHNP